MTWLNGEWGDIVEHQGNTLKLSRVKICDDGSVGQILYGHKQLKNGGWHKNEQYIWLNDSLKLIERPAALNEPEKKS